MGVAFEHVFGGLHTQAFDETGRLYRAFHSLFIDVRSFFVPQSVLKIFDFEVHTVNITTANLNLVPKLARSQTNS